MLKARAAALLAVLSVAALAATLTAGSLAGDRTDPPAARGDAGASGASEVTRSSEAAPAASGADRSQRPAWPRPQYRDSRALGEPGDGRLVHGVRLPREGRDFFSWDPIERQSPSRPWRRWGTDGLVRTLLEVLSEYRDAHPAAARVGIGDLSRPNGGDFGPQYGIVGHATHQNGLDADLYYPLEGGAERPPESVSEIDMRLAQELVDAFVAAGAKKVYVGPSTPLSGPPDVVEAVPGHDLHLHVRI